jgi:hypothetical protein
MIILGWLINYQKENEHIKVVNEGLMRGKGINPQSFEITTYGSLLSVVWTGSYKDLEIKKTIELGSNDLFFTTSVVIKNIGTAAINDLYCKFLCCIF